LTRFLMACRSAGEARTASLQEREGLNINSRNSVTRLFWLLLRSSNLPMRPEPTRRNKTVSQSYECVNIVIMRQKMRFCCFHDNWRRKIIMINVGQQKPDSNKFCHFKKCSIRMCMVKIRVRARDTSLCSFGLAKIMRLLAVPSPDPGSESLL
jgi:hypothetical protein